MNDSAFLPQTTDEPEVGRGSMLFLRSALVLASLIVLGFLVFTVVSLLDRGETQPGTTSSSELQAELDVFVDEAVAFIEAVRGRSFLERPTVELVDGEEMTTIVLDDLAFDQAEDPEQAAASLAFARAIGFFGPSDEFLDVYDVFVSGGVLGVYFPRTDQLLVRSSDELTLMTKATVVHELVHAFDDQHFDLSRDELAEDGDVGWAFAAAAEGSASYVENLWREELSESEQVALTAEELSFDAGDLFSLDFGFLVYQASVYEAGERWLERRIQTEGVAAIDDALLNGAPSSEVVLEPLDAEALAPVIVDAPEVTGEVLWRGTGGQALVSALTFMTDTSGDVARGWGGDAMTVYRNLDGDECLRWDLATDSRLDTVELLTGLRAWASAVGAEIVEVGDRVRVDRCA